MNINDLTALWLAEEQHAFAGWDFSHLNGRWESGTVHWDYKALIQSNLSPTSQLLDMGTGGGEFLLTLGHAYENTSVTEAWAPNIALCMERLSPLGITVHALQSDLLPMEDNRFDLVINRHESYDLSEVSRVLKPNGLFITQQVGSEDCAGLSAHLNEAGSPFTSPFTLDTELERFQQHGFTVIQSQQCYPPVKFYDIGAIVFWAKVLPWAFPEFSVHSHLPKLKTLQQKLEQQGHIVDQQHRFMLLARNSK